MSDHSTLKRGGLQVVKMSEIPGQRFEVDEEVLASVLLRPDIRSLPVVVVSVAGAYRGGKSFILDFFLRYLLASRDQQLSGNWLGNDEDLLEGFDWRGGGESNTKGIHLWPEPIVVTIQRTGQKVAVLLMDTQGTFDTDSDMGDNSTIFALSTLLSSVQIYNISANIGEDHLQHLQLFTEYGRLAKQEQEKGNAEGKAFQTLLFLVRDWMSAWEHPHGYTGGKAMMDKRLTAKSNQKQQLVEVREHIHSCFETLLCFLMPHPGMRVADEYFKGRLGSIDEKFKKSLLELVPSLFDPENLLPKTINGEKVQTQGLLEFFKQYVNIYNSEGVPQATTILQATAEACMMSAIREARECYENHMDSKVTEDQSVTTDMMHTWHRDALAAAIAYFQNKRKLGSQNIATTYLDDLEKELGARLSLYLWQNDAKVRSTLTDAKNAYNGEVSLVSEDHTRLCLHKKDLMRLHSRATRVALETFDAARPGVQQDQDTDRTGLIESLDQFYERMCAVNAQNNRNATLEARELYLSRMKDGVNLKGVSTAELEKQHKNSMKAAVEHFKSHRSVQTEETKDPDLDQLVQEIETFFLEFEKSNAHSNLWAMQVAEYAYNNGVSSAWGPQCCCFHPQALKDLHMEATDRALEQFLKDRTESLEDDYKDKLISNLESRYEELRNINAFSNTQSVELSMAEYTRRMDKHSQPGISSILIAPFIIKSVGLQLALSIMPELYKMTFILLPRHHTTARNVAVGMFNDKRRGRSYSNDEYKDDLLSKIDEAFEDYKNPLKAMIRELGLQHLLPDPSLLRD